MSRISLSNITSILIPLVIVFQILTLSAPTMNGDEAIYLLIVEEWHKIWAGVWPSLNPLIEYSGPLDFWIMGSVYGLTSFLSAFPAGAWMVRIIPLTVFWCGAWTLHRQIRASISERLAAWFLIFASSTPMVLVYSRAGFPHSLMLGLFSFLLGESLRISQTGQVRWLRITLAAGLATETNTTAFVGILAIFAPVLLTLLKAAKTQVFKSIGAIAIFTLLALPVLKNFPPPVAVASETGPSLLAEFQSFLLMVGGQQPLKFFFLQDPVPQAVTLLLLVGLAGLQLRQIQDLRKRPFLLGQGVSHLIAAGFLFYFGFQGRSLTLVGHERYFICLIPGSLLLVAHSFESLRLNRETAIAALVAAFLFLRFAIPMGQFAFQTDPALAAARWLAQECPRDRCLAYAENFWNYWPIRFYTRDAIDLNIYDPCWKSVVRHAPGPRQVVGCWFEGSYRMYRGRFEKEVVFPAAMGGPAQHCFVGIDL